MLAKYWLECAACLVTVRNSHKNIVSINEHPSVGPVDTDIPINTPVCDTD